MKPSSALGVQFKAIKTGFTAIWAVFPHFFEHGKSGRFTGSSGIGSG
jgi:hypothetical protein